MSSELDHKYLSNQLIKLGDMMGDGMHHEPDGKWISAEYRKISKLLYPEEFKEKRRQKSDKINERIAELLTTTKCKCGGTLKQSRSGSRIIRCTENLCNSQYKLGKARK